MGVPVILYRGMRIAPLQTNTGHSEIAMTNHYLHVQPEVRQNAVSTLNQFFWGLTGRTRAEILVRAKKFSGTPGKSNAFRKTAIAPRANSSTTLVRGNYGNSNSLEKLEKSPIPFGISDFYGPSVEIRTQGLLNPMDTSVEKNPHKVYFSDHIGVCWWHPGRITPAK